MPCNIEHKTDIYYDEPKLHYHIYYLSVFAEGHYAWWTEIGGEQDWKTLYLSDWLQGLSEEGCLVNYDWWEKESHFWIQMTTTSDIPN